MTLEIFMANTSQIATGSTHLLRHLNCGNLATYNSCQENVFACYNQINNIFCIF